MPYRFFFSYARENRDPLLNRFYEDLCKQVRLKKFHETGKVGFFDGEAIKAGAPWKIELGEAIRTAMSFVAICSPDYVNSEYCGKELNAFLGRYNRYLENTNLVQRPRLLQAVIWGAPSGSLHQAVTGFQYTDDEYPAVYAAEGLRYMMQLKDYEDDYKEFVTRLAHKLVDYSEQHPLPEASRIPELDQIESAFSPRRQETPDSDGNSAWFVFVAAKPGEFPSDRRSVDRYKLRGGRDWKPFAPDSIETVGIIAQATASKYSFYYEELQLNGEIETQIEEAERRGEPVIVIVDAWTLRISSYRDWMLRLDRRNFENCVVLVPVNHPDPETDRSVQDLERIVKDTFKWRTSLRNKFYFRHSIYSARELRSLLLKSFAEFTNRTVEKSGAAREINNRGIRRRLWRKEFCSIRHRWSHLLEELGGERFRIAAAHRHLLFV